MEPDTDQMRDDASVTDSHDEWNITTFELKDSLQQHSKEAAGLLRFKITPTIKLAAASLIQKYSDKLSKDERRFWTLFTQKIPEGSSPARNESPLAPNHQNTICWQDIKKLVSTLNAYSESDKDKYYVHQLLKGSEPVTFIKPVKPPPNKEYLERIAKLKRQAEQREYDKMTKSLQTKRDTAVGQEIQEANFSMSIGINILASMFAAGMAGWFVLSYRTSEVFAVVGGLMASIFIMIVEIWLFIIRDTEQGVSNLEKKYDLEMRRRAWKREFDQQEKQVFHITPAKITESIQEPDKSLLKRRGNTGDAYESGKET